jgi:hypothetical protein
MEVQIEGFTIKLTEEELKIDEKNIDLSDIGTQMSFFCSILHIDAAFLISIICTRLRREKVCD